MGEVERTGEVDRVGRVERQEMWEGRIRTLACALRESLMRRQEAFGSKITGRRWKPVAFTSVEFKIERRGA